MADSTSESQDSGVGATLPISLAAYGPAEIKKLYYRSRSINGIAILMALAVVGLLANLVLGEGGISTKVALAAIAFFFGFAIAGARKRTAWGRPIGIISCCVMLLSVPFGTLVGILGLFAFGKAKALFGPGRVTHAEVKLAFHATKGT